MYANWNRVMYNILGKDSTPIADCHSNYNTVDASSDVVFTSDSRFVSENISQYNKI